jgi:hypothetical protein
MWLPKDERILLRYYYSQGRADNICQRDPDTIIKELREKKKQKGKHIDETFVMNVLRALQKHALVQGVKKVRETGQIEVKLSSEVINLGRKYSSTIGTMGVWFTEHMWFWIVLGVAISAIALIVTILRN